MLYFGLVDHLHRVMKSSSAVMKESAVVVEIEKDEKGAPCTSIHVLVVVFSLACLIFSIVVLFKCRFILVNYMMFSQKLCNTRTGVDNFA